MNSTIKKTTAVIFMLLASTLMLATITANAQSPTPSPTQAVVQILASAGGTTTPGPGNYTYDNGVYINLSAAPQDGFQFVYWVVGGAYTAGHTGASNGGYYVDPDTGVLVPLPNPGIATSGINALVFTANPANITCGYGYTYTYQAIFAPVSGTPTPTPTPIPQTSPPTNTSEVVIILAGLGGTSDPAPGTYVYGNQTPFTLTATADAGYAFHYWIVSGSYVPGHLAQPQIIPGVSGQYPTVPANIYYPTQDSLVFSTNPATITCGYGYTYYYQPVFTPVNSTVPVVPTSTPFPSGAPTPSPTATTTPLSTTSPTATATPTPTPAVTPTPAPAGTDYTWVIVALVVVIIIIIIVVAAAMMRRKK